MPLHIVVQIFNTYLLPIFTYCSAIWANDIRSQNAIDKMNAVFTNYMKRYLGVPKYVQNAAIHFYCGTWPLYNAIKHLNLQTVLKLNFPPNALENYQLSFANALPLPAYKPELEMDPDFPRRDVGSTFREIDCIGGTIFANY